VDFLSPEVARLLAGIDAAGDRLDAACEKLAAGVDPVRGISLDGKSTQG
jgi:hypothetical protein